MLHLYCKTSVAVLLLGIKDEHGVMRFPRSGDERAAGYVFDVLPRVPINEQLVEHAGRALGEPVRLSLAVQQEFADEMPLADGTLATVYLATLADAAAERIKARSEWPSLPDILRGMDRDRRRLPYLRAWQILTGGLKLNTKAVDANELKNLFDT